MLVAGLLVLGLVAWAYSTIIVKELKKECNFTHY